MCGTTFWQSVKAWFGKVFNTIFGDPHSSEGNGQKTSPNVNAGNSGASNPNNGGNGNNGGIPILSRNKIRLGIEGNGGYGANITYYDDAAYGAYMREINNAPSVKTYENDCKEAWGVANGCEVRPLGTSSIEISSGASTDSVVESDHCLKLEDDYIWIDGRFVRINKPGENNCPAAAAGNIFEVKGIAYDYYSLSNQLGDSFVLDSRLAEVMSNYNICFVNIISDASFNETSKFTNCFLISYIPQEQMDNPFRYKLHGHDCICEVNGANTVILNDMHSPMRQGMTQNLANEYRLNYSNSNPCAYNHMYAVMTSSEHNAYMRYKYPNMYK
jgi:hypothetical protein